MPPEELAYLEELLSAANELQTYIAGASVQRYLTDGMLRRAVERCLEIVGEALIRIRRSDEQLLTRIPDASKIIGMRNLLAHEYGRVDSALLWQAVQDHLPTLMQAVQQEIDRLK